ncbi:MAG: hypothetical protein Q9202_005652 [Teloschistes flavicans]
MGAIFRQYALQATSNAPKPNTRFLKTIIKETDSHNAALKAKEVADARVRLRSIDRHEVRIEKHSRKDSRQEGPDYLSLTRPKLRGNGNEVHGRGPAKTTPRDTEHKKHNDSQEDPYDDEESTPSEARHSHRHRLQHHRRADPLNGDHYPAPSPSPSSDSDPLASLVGPLPPPLGLLPRGRGAHNSTTSNIDTHFNSTYDPSTDLNPTLPADSDDWDNALEALRDRARWKASGAERLRAAGFSDEEVRKWERGGEGKEEEVVWKGRGEGREWDRGKVVEHDGVHTEVEWGRLKGT